MPKVKLFDYRKMTVEVPPVPNPSEADLTALLIHYQTAMAKIKEVQRPARMGDRVVVDLITLKRGKPVPLGHQQELEVMMFEGVIADGFVEKLVGAEVGKSYSISATLPEIYFVEAYRNQKVKYDVYVKHVFEQELPTVDELPELLGFDSVDTLMDALYQEQAETYNTAWKKSVRKNLLIEVGQRSGIHIPPNLLEAEMVSRWEKQDEPVLKAQGVPEKLIDKSLDVWCDSKSIQNSIREDLIASLVYREIAHQENFQLTSADILWTLKPYIDHFNLAVEELVEEIQSSGKLEVIYSQLMMEMVINHVYAETELVCEGEIIKPAA